MDKYVICPTCSRLVSPLAKACPSCAHPITKKLKVYSTKGKSKKADTALGCLYLFVLLAIIGFIMEVYDTITYPFSKEEYKVISAECSKHIESLADTPYKWNTSVDGYRVRFEKIKDKAGDNDILILYSEASGKNKSFEVINSSGSYITRSIYCEYNKKQKKVVGAKIER